MVDNFSKDIVETFIKNDSVIQKYKDSFTTDPDQFVKRVKENPDSDTYLLIQDPITEMWGTINTGKDKK